MIKVKRNKTNILYLIDSFNRGGKERQLLEILSAFSKNSSFSISLVLLNNRVGYSEIYDFGIPIYVLRDSKKLSFSLFKLIKIIVKVRPDIIHTWEGATTFLVSFLRPFFSFKLVDGTIRWAHNPNYFPIYQRLLFKWNFFIADVIVSNSQLGINIYAPFKKSMVVYNGFNNRRLVVNVSEPIKKLLKKPESFVVGMVANFTKNKDYITYFEAAAKVLPEKSNIIFVALGSGPKLDGIVRDYSDLIDSGRMVVVSNATNVEEFVSLFDIGVLISFAEGISNAIMEYQAFGKPVIASDSGATSEIIVDGINGYLIAEADITDLAAKIILLEENPELRSELGQRGKEMLASKFSLDGMLQKYENLYIKIAATGQ
jgi:glycosyltransferase involved in cell wall biosynthesis